MGICAEYYVEFKEYWVFYLLLSLLLTCILK
jgi:hypothetical protein